MVHALIDSTVSAQSGHCHNSPLHLTFCDKAVLSANIPPMEQLPSLTMAHPIAYAIPAQAGLRLQLAPALLLVLICMGGQAFAHTTYLRPVDYQPDPGDSIDILIYHGTFDESAQSIIVEVIDEIKGYGPNGPYPINKQGWSSREPGSKAWQRWNQFKYKVGASNLRRTSILDWSSKEEGFHLVGVEVKPSRVALDEQKFHEYLVEVGLQDEPINEFQPVNADGIFTEIFIKTAKTILQVGDAGIGKVTEPLGLSSEIVPLQNPMELKAGDTMIFKLLLRGRPLANQVVLAGQPQGFAGKGRGVHTAYRSDAQGNVSITFPEDGEWWIAFDNIRIAQPGNAYDLLSHWTTLTFEIDP